MVLRRFSSFSRGDKDKERAVDMPKASQAPW
jgi:hypothetical protein